MASLSLNGLVKVVADLELLLYDVIRAFTWLFQGASA